MDDEPLGPSGCSLKTRSRKDVPNFMISEDVLLLFVLGVRCASRMFKTTNPLLAFCTFPRARPSPQVGPPPSPRKMGQGWLLTNVGARMRDFATVGFANSHPESKSGPPKRPDHGFQAWWRTRKMVAVVEWGGGEESQGLGPNRPLNQHHLHPFAGLKRYQVRSTLQVYVKAFGWLTRGQ